MSDGQIPITPDDLQFDVEPLPENASLEGTIVSYKEGIDKNGDAYIGIVIHITGPDEWEGRVISDNYIRVVKPLQKSMTSVERRKTMDQNVTMTRMLAAFGYRDDKAVALINERDWSSLVGQSGKFTSGRSELFGGQMRTRVGYYLV